MAIEAGLSHSDVPQAVLERDPKVEGYVRDLTPIFEDPRVYTFLETLGKTVAQRRQETKVSGHISLGSAVHDVQTTLGWPDADIAQMKGRYDEIVLLFLPEFQRRAKSKARKMGGDFDEWQSIAAEKLTSSVAYFDWKTFKADPEDTVKIFLSSTEKSLYDPSRVVYSTQGSEVYPLSEFVDKASPVEDEVAERQQHDELNQLIERYTRHKRQRRILQDKIFYDLPNEKIAVKEKVKASYVKRVVRDFKKSLPEPFLSGVPREKGWQEIFKNGVDKYRKLYQAKRHTLTPYFQELLDLFFELNTGERVSTVDAIYNALVAKGRKIQPQSVRRNVLAGLHILDNKERLSRTGAGPMGKYNKRDLMLKAHNDPSFFSGLNSQQQRLVDLYFQEISQGRKPFQRGVAKTMGVHESTVSRDLVRIEKAYRRSRDKFK